MRVVVCGAGIGGLALAWWLERDGHDVLLVERAPGPHGAGYMLDCQGPGYDAVERMGLLPRLVDHAFQLSALVYHEDSGAVRDRFTHEGPGADRVVSLMRGDLEAILHEALGDRTEIRYRTSVAAFTQNPREVTVTLTDGTEERADLLVGADGVHSRVRELAFGTTAPVVWDLGLHTAGYVLHDPDTARQLGRALHMLDAPGLQVGAYPVRGEWVATLFVHRTTFGAPLPEDPRAELRRVYGDRGWIVPRLLDRCPPPDEVYYDSVAQVMLPRWTLGRTALLGDACGAPSLLSGEGAGLALAGAEMLAGELRAADHVPAALQRYVARLSPEVTRAQDAAREMAEDFVPAGMP